MADRLKPHRPMPDPGGALLAISDLHIRHQTNRDVVAGLHPEHPDDWLIVAGDVAERLDDILWALDLLSRRFARVIWVPGNHELWTTSRAGGPDALRGQDRYQLLVTACRELGVTTPEDPYPLWTGGDRPVRVVPLFLLYDYSFRPRLGDTRDEALARAWQAGIVCSDEIVLWPAPYASRDAWCQARVKLTEERLDQLDTETPLVLVNHFPLVPDPLRVLDHPEVALWCGTDRTADWHRRYPVAAVVYGHLHIRRTMWLDGVPHIEVSMGYPRDWARTSRRPEPVRVLA